MPLEVVPFEVVPLDVVLFPLAVVLWAPKAAKTPLRLRAASTEFPPPTRTPARSSPTTWNEIVSAALPDALVDARTAYSLPFASLSNVV